jgi:hypothetical protein
MTMHFSRLAGNTSKVAGSSNLQSNPEYGDQQLVGHELAEWNDHRQ